MIRLKKLRLARGETQADVARQLKTTQQTYARWEAGKSEPSLASLRDIARLFGTTVDHILGRGPDVAASNQFHLLASGADGYWGHLALQFPKAAITHWYPITVSQAERVEEQLAFGSRASEWMIVQTLDHRLVAFRPGQAKRIRLTDEADEGPSEAICAPTELGGEGGLSPELYQALAEWADSEMEGCGLFEANNSPELQREVLTLIARANLTQRPDHVRKLLRNTVVHHLDGDVDSFEVDREGLAAAFLELDINPHIKFLALPACEQGPKHFFSTSELTLVEFPIVEIDAADDDYEFGEEVVRPSAGDEDTITSGIAHRGDGGGPA